MVAESEVKVKEERVRGFMEAEGDGAVLLKRQANFCWMTCGGLNLVGRLCRKLWNDRTDLESICNN